MAVCTGLASFSTAQEKQHAPPPTAETARAYLAKALDAMEKHSLRRSEIDWSDLRHRAFERAANAKVPSETYETIRWAVKELGDGHSFFMAPTSRPSKPSSNSQASKSLKQASPPSDSHSNAKANPASKPMTKTRTIAGSGWVIASTAEDMHGELITKTLNGRERHVGYLLVPSFGGEDSFDPAKASQFANRLHDHIRRLDQSGATAWIVDLRFNSGGNMWPMLAGVGPLLNAKRVGAFVRKGEESVYWEYAEGRAGTMSNVNAVIDKPYTLKNPNAKLVVLVGKYCTSSGEAIAVAFRGRENTRFLGKPTGGATTSTQSVWMGDGAMLFVTNAIYADRTGAVYGGTLIPDDIIADSPDELADPRPPLLEDPGISAAWAWLLQD
jgi:C-terminal processing protease CtpA/Prc